MTDRITKLCDLLEDIDEPPKPEDKAQADTSAKKSGNGKGKSNLKLRLFQHDQRIEDIERRLAEMQEIASAELLEGSKDCLDPSARAAAVPESPKPRPPAEGSGLKGVLARHEMSLNDLNLRISEVENGMQKIEPNNMRALIRDIAELVMQEEKREVSAAMDGIKGSQQRHVQLVETLKSNLKELNDRFTNDIDRKIERKDFNITKNQLRRKLQELESRVRGKDPSAGTSTYRSSSQCPMMLYNSKCFFCNQSVQIPPELINFCRTRYSPKGSFLKDMNFRGQRYGPGYSHVLNSLKDKFDESSLPRSSSKYEGDMKCLGSGANARRSDADLRSTGSVKLAPIKFRDRRTDNQ